MAETSAGRDGQRGNSIGDRVRPRLPGGGDHEGCTLNGSRAGGLHVRFRRRTHRAGRPLQQAGQKTESARELPKTKISNPNEGLNPMASQTYQDNQENQEAIFTNTRTGRVWFKSQDVECLVHELNVRKDDAEILLYWGGSASEVLASVKKNWEAYTERRTVV